jgi:hypothetical protein
MRRGCGAIALLVALPTPHLIAQGTDSILRVRRRIERFGLSLGRR